MEGASIVDLTEQSPLHDNNLTGLNLHCWIS